MTELNPSYAAIEIYDALSNDTVIDGSKTLTVDWYRDLMHWNTVLKDVTIEGVVL